MPAPAWIFLDPATSRVLPAPQEAKGAAGAACTYASETDGISATRIAQLRMEAIFELMRNPADSRADPDVRRIACGTLSSIFVDNRDQIFQAFDAVDIVPHGRHSIPSAAM